MATLAIAAITVSMAAPMMSNLVTGNRQASETNELISTFHAARSTAITLNEQVTICPSSDAEQCNDAQWQDGWIFFVDADHDRHVGAGDAILGSANGMSHTKILTQDFDRFIVFRPNGHIMVDTAAENSGAFLLCNHRDSNFNQSLILHAGGKPQLVVEENPEVYKACQEF